MDTPSIIEPTEQPKYGARVYVRADGRVNIKQTIRRPTARDYVIDKNSAGDHRERFVSRDNDAEIASIIRGAIDGRL